MAAAEEDGNPSVEQRLVDAKDLQGLLALITVDDIARTWHRYHAAPEAAQDGSQDWWAVELFLHPGILQRGPLLRELLLKLIEHAPDSYAVGMVAAGPLEDFVSDDEEDLQWLERRCLTNAGLRSALPGMWVSGTTAETLARLDAAAGEMLPRPRPRSELPPSLVAVRDAEERFAAIAPGCSVYDVESLTDEQRHAAEALKAAERRFYFGEGPRKPRTNSPDR